MPLVIQPLTPVRLPDLADLFGERGPACRCWCMYWRIGAGYRRRAPAENKADFSALVEQGPPPGLLAYDGDLPVGWCQLTPREDLPYLDRYRRLARVDDRPVWCISCFYIRKDYRRQGVTAALIAAAIDVARRAGAPALEAYPLDADLSPSSTHTGYATTFTRAGFKEIARHVPSRPIMRYEFWEGSDGC